ncbi:MAG: PilN domain-containing protein [Alphaproteobacteria bacterium]|nr:PilN domain-containing protein [Alphaproteobacteria bacterium]MBL7099089.1 PilN domain-containing protein [Alphaproteobacteria bacterium]
MGGALLRPDAWIEWIVDGWRWWTGELAAVLPKRVRDALATGDDAILVTAHDNELVVSRRTGLRELFVARIPRDAAAARALRLSVPQRGFLADPVILHLPPSQALSRVLTLPGAARRNLDGILKYEIARHSPVGTDEIYYEYRILGREADSMTVGLRIAHRDAVNPTVEFFRDAGIPLARITFADDAKPAAGGTFPADAAATRQLRLRSRLVPALAGLVLALAFGVVGAVYLRGQAVADDLTDRVAAARPRAAVVEQLQRQLDAAYRQAAFLTQQKRDVTSAAILAAVARTLPDDAWIYEFELNGDEVRVHGFSSSAASLIALFDSSKLFHDAEMRAPLMQGPTNATQRFDIAFRVRRP